MNQAFETAQEAAKKNLDLAVKSLSSTAKSIQDMATETTNYTKKAFEHGSSTIETLVGAKSVEKALEVQADYAKSAYEGFVAYATKLGSMVTDLSKEAIKPLEAAVSKSGK
jgi:hypothetical protein